ncbi:hypothetical protein [Actinorugispora endophytica]|uniref:DUF4352 domain-containing protein n=1 Tax=Actinorugispora endophytica TaxID=1605990 RepID=A0A4R6V8F4_9ACTN|nr:hypothetical protein [Actinorugispora endophytica]TDQ55436.1 hypothetical protein EV190_101763 [Actinorugispora endophytica]
MTRDFRRRVGVFALSVVLLVLIGLAHQTYPTRNELTAPISHRGDAGAPVDARRFAIEVDRVELARAVNDPESSPDSAEAGPGLVWVVVWATVTATEEPLRIGNPVLLETADGYSFAGDTTMDSPLNGFSVVQEPGLGRYGAFAFEVPRERLSDLSLRVTASGDLDTRLSAQAVVDLGLDAARLEEMLDTAADSVEIAPPEYR